MPEKSICVKRELHGTRSVCQVTRVGASIVYSWSLKKIVLFPYMYESLAIAVVSHKNFVYPVKQKQVGNILCCFGVYRFSLLSF